MRREKKNAGQFARSDEAHCIGLDGSDGPMSSPVAANCSAKHAQAAFERLQREA